MIIVQFLITCFINGFKYEKVATKWDRVTNWCVYLTNGHWPSLFQHPIASCPEHTTVESSVTWLDSNHFGVEQVRGNLHWFIGWEQRCWSANGWIHESKNDKSHPAYIYEYSKWTRSLASRVQYLFYRNS